MPVSPRLPKFLGEYALLRPLRKGQDHLRYAVRREVQSHPRLFVVKLFDAIPEGTPETQRERYVPRITRGMSHRNLVESYEAGEITGRNYLVMEYVLSVDLEYVLERCRQIKEPMPFEVALFVGREICRGLAFLHGFGADKLLHGRVAPSHTLLAYSGQLKLAHVHRLLKVGVATETMESTDRIDAYQAPELLEGRPVDQRADVFAVGAILWECFSGQRFELGSASDVSVRENATLGRISLTDFNSELPEDLVETITRAIKLMPEDRHRTAVDLGRRLDAHLEKHCQGAGGRSTSDWLVSLFRDEFRERRHVQQQLLAEKRAETASQAIIETEALGIKPETGDLEGIVLDQRYKVKRLIGEGGMGRVYEAEHTQLGKRLAVKVLHPLYSTEEEVVERFRREARAASSIGHPNIVNVTDYGTTPDGRAYFVMELLDGMELADVITQEGPLDYERAVDISIQVCQALGAAHQVGIIHRDMKPENVYLTTVGGRTDVVKILDFGIAKSARLERVRGGQLTEPGLAVGTPEYMAPEQAAGKPPDARFDIYAVGGILYAVLTGRPPHRGSNVLEILTRKATRNPTPPRSYRPDIPVELERAIVNALARNPDRRPQNMEEFEYELRKSLQGRPNAVAHMLGISDAIGVLEHRSSSSDRMRAVSTTPPRPVGGARPTVSDLPSDYSLSTDALSLPQEPGRTSRRATPGESYSLTGVDGEEVEELPPPPASRYDRPTDVPSLRDEPIELFDPEPRAAPSSAQSGSGGEAVTELYVPTMDLVDEQEARPRLSTHARQLLLGLVGGTIALVVSAWTLWPTHGEPRALNPGEVERPPATEPVEESDAGTRTGRLVPVIGLKMTVDAGAPSASARARRWQRSLQRWVDFSWRAARDRRFLEPDRDNVKFGLERIAGLDAGHESLGKLRTFTARQLLAQARHRRRRGDYEGAEKLLRGLLELAPESDRAKRDLARVLIGKGRRALKADKVAEAEELAKQALLLDPQGLPPRFFAIDLLIKADKLQEALAGYEAILKEHRRNREARTAIRKLQRLIKKQRRRRR
ncbi:MAG: protein kinase [bacterium]